MDKTRKTNNRKNTECKSENATPLKSVSTRRNLPTNRNLVSSLVAMTSGVKLFSSQTSNQSANNANSPPKMQSQSCSNNLHNDKQGTTDELEYSYASGSSVKSSSSSIPAQKLQRRGIQRINPSTSNNLAPKTVSILQALNELNLAGEISTSENTKYNASLDIYGKLLAQRSTPTSSRTNSPRDGSEIPPAKPQQQRQRQSKSPSNTIKDMLTTTQSPSSKSFNQLILEAPDATILSRQGSNVVHTNLDCSSINNGIRSQPKLQQKTPKWISKIFHLTRNGRLDQLRNALFGLDLTVIRYLVDIRGNNLLHCSVRNGDLETLQWFGSILGDLHFEAALSDRNGVGNDVIRSALKYGQLECLQWLIINTSTGSNALVPKDGKRSLLHHAVKYNKPEEVQFLCEVLRQFELPIDIRDTAFQTPLHLAAKFGHIHIAQVLIQFGADPSCQAELGCRPADIALKHRQMEAVSFFTMAEAAVTLGNDFHTFVTQFGVVQNRYETIRTQFRELLRVSKCLVKERSDLIKHFSLCGSNNTSPETIKTLLLGESTNGARFSDLEHKLSQAEQAWKQIESKQQHFDSSLTLSSSGGCLFGLQDTAASLQEDFSLQKYINALQPTPQQSKSSSGSTFDLSSSSTSDENSLHSESETSSEDEEYIVDNGIPSCNDEEPMYHNVRNVDCMKITSLSGSNGLSSHSSISAPWLLPSSENSILASLSPGKLENGAGHSIRPNLDILQSIPSTSSASNPQHCSNPKQSSETMQIANSTTKFPSFPFSCTQEPSTRVMTSEPKSDVNLQDLHSDSTGPAVIEVLEPDSKPANAKPSSSLASMIGEQSRSTFNAGRNSSHQKMSLGNGNQDLERHDNGHFATTEGKPQSKKQLNPEFTSLVDGSAVWNSDILNQAKKVHFTPELILKTDNDVLNVNQTELNSSKFQEPEKIESVTVENKLSHYDQTTQPKLLSQAQEVNTSDKSIETTISIVKSRRKMFETNLTVLPVTTSHSDMCSPFTQSRIPITKSVPVSSTKIMSLSIKPNYTQGKLQLPQQSSPAESTGSLNGHQSPNPSDTESNFAPPSQTSQNSEVSKTESGRCEPTYVTTSPAPVPSAAAAINHCIEPASSVTKVPSEIGIGYMIDKGRKRCIDEDKSHCDHDSSNQMKNDDKEDNDKDKGQMMERKEGKTCYGESVADASFWVSDGGISLFLVDGKRSATHEVQSSITLPVTPATTNPTLSPNTFSINTYKPFHNNKGLIKMKAARRQPKPWYEIDMSEDEDENMFHAVRTRSRSSHSSRRNDTDDNESDSEELESEKCDLEKELDLNRKQRHKCDETTCSQHNCPNFV